MKHRQMSFLEFVLSALPLLCVTTEVGGQTVSSSPVAPNFAGNSMCSEYEVCEIPKTDVKTTASSDQPQAISARVTGLLALYSIR